MKRNFLLMLLMTLLPLAGWGQGQQIVLDPLSTLIPAGYPVYAQDGDNTLTFYLSSDLIAVGENAPEVISVTLTDNTLTEPEPTPLAEGTNWSQAAPFKMESQTKATKVGNPINVTGVYYIQVTVEGKVYYVPFTVASAEGLETELVWDEASWNKSKDPEAAKKGVFYYYFKNAPYFDLYKAATTEPEAPEFAGNIDPNEWDNMTDEAKAAYTHDWKAITKSSVKRNLMFPQLCYFITPGTGRWYVKAQYRTSRVEEGTRIFNPWRTINFRNDDTGAPYVYETGKQFWMLSIPELFAGKYPLASGGDNVEGLANGEDYVPAYGEDGSVLPFGETTGVAETLNDALEADFTYDPENPANSNLRLLMVPAGDAPEVITEGSGIDVTSYAVTVASTTTYKGEDTAPAITVTKTTETTTVEANKSEYIVKYFLGDEEVTRLNVKQVELQETDGVKSIVSATPCVYTAKVYLANDGQAGEFIGEGQFTVAPAAQLTVELAQIFPTYYVPAKGDFSVNYLEMKKGDNEHNVEIIGDFSVTNLQDFKFSNKYYEYTILGSTVKAISHLEGKDYQNYSVKLITGAQAYVSPASLTLDLTGSVNKTYGDKDGGTGELAATGVVNVLDENGFKTDETIPFAISDNYKVRLVVSREEGEDAGEYDLTVVVEEQYRDNDGNWVDEWIPSDNFAIDNEGFTRTAKGTWTWEDGFKIFKRSLEDVVTVTEPRVYNDNKWTDAPDFVKFYDVNGVFTATNQSNEYHAASPAQDEVLYTAEDPEAQADPTLVGTVKTPAKPEEGAYVLLAKETDYTVGNFKDNKSVQYTSNEVDAKSKFTITATEGSINFKDAKDDVFKIIRRRLPLKIVLVDDKVVFGTKAHFTLEPDAENTTAENGFVGGQTIESDYVNLDVEGNVVYKYTDAAGTQEVTADLKQNANRGGNAATAVARNYDPIFKPLEITVNKLTLEIASLDQNGAYKVMNGEIDVTTDDAFLHNGANVGTYVRPDVKPAALDNPATTEVNEATVSVSTDLPEGVVVSDLVTLSRTTTTVGNTAENFITVTVKPEAAANYDITPKSTGKFIIPALAELHLSYNGVGQALEDHKGKQTNVWLPNRSLIEDTWYSFVLPFDFYAPTLANKVWYGVANTLDETKNDNNIHFELAMGNITANTPFIFKIAHDPDATIDADNTDPTLKYGTYQDKVVLKKAALAEVHFDNVTIGNGTTFAYNSTSMNPYVVDQKGHKFYGTYNEYITNANDWFLASNGKFYNEYQGTPGGYKLLPTEGYIDLNANAGVKPYFFVQEADGSTTAIRDIDAEEAKEINAEGMYDLNGMKVNAPTKKGIYIKDGKKYVIK